MLPELASHAILPRVVGLSNAADLLLTGRMISGTEATRLGLESEALPREQVLAAAQARARVGRGTSVYRHEDDAGWRLVHRHADPIVTPRGVESWHS